MMSQRLRLHSRQAIRTHARVLNLLALRRRIAFDPRLQEFPNSGNVELELAGKRRG
jgi:hypothetical protein